MKFIFVLLFLGLFNLSVFAQRYEFSLDARSKSLGGAYSSIKGDAYSVFYNPATLYFLKGWAISASFFNPFSEERIISSSGSVVAGYHFGSPWAEGSFAISYDIYRADPIYQQWAFSFHHAFPIVPKILSLGWAIKYDETQVGVENPSLGRLISMDVGANIILKKVVSVSLSGGNLIVYENGTKPSGFLPIIRAGVSTTVLSNFLFSLDVSYEWEESLSFHFGQEWNFKEIFFIRTGIATEPIYVALGIGARIYFVDIDYALSWQPDLGITHLISLQVKIAQKKSKQQKQQKSLQSIKS